jgi:hypothetical protein
MPFRGALAAPLLRSLFLARCDQTQRCNSLVVIAGIAGAGMPLEPEVLVANDPEQTSTRLWTCVRSRAKLGPTIWNIVLELIRAQIGSLLQ